LPIGVIVRCFAFGYKKLYASLFVAKPPSKRKTKPEEYACRQDNMPEMHTVTPSQNSINKNFVNNIISNKE
jgi:hypothetical protein